VTADAVVIGAGPNGLVAANLLADAGWDVVVLEAQPEPGGAVRSADVLEPGFVTDRFSAFYPLGAVSPHLEALELDRHGLQWSHAPAVLAHPVHDHPAAVLHRDLDLSAASLDAFAAGDGDAWRSLMTAWADVETDLIGAFMGPFPPVRAVARLVAGSGVAGSAELARRALIPVQRLSEESFDGDGAGLLLAGSALHADVTPSTALSGLLGWLLAGIGQRHGWPVPVGGSGALTGALVHRLRSIGGRIRCSAEVEHIDVARGRACGVRLRSGERIAARHAVLADVVAPKLYGGLVDSAELPASFRRRLHRYQPGSATFKVNWTLDGPIPWSDPAVAGAGTVHIAESMAELTITSAQLAAGQVPSHPFVLVGQMATADPSRAPAGRESIWAYTDVPQEVRSDAAGEVATLEGSDAERFADRMQQRIEAHAPGFGSLVRRRQVQTPASMEHDDANLINGDKNLGSAQLHQQLIFRPVLGFARPETPVSGLFLASASAHPGGGVHGSCGAHAARAAIWARRRRHLPLVR